MVVRRHFGDIIRRTHTGKEHFIVEKDGLALAALISITDYEELMRERQDRERRLKRFAQINKAFSDEAKRLCISEEDMMAELEKTKERVFQEQYGDDR
ncbi:MAG: hypothetical protein COU69_01250 [Candidatus Pacebacteria bacterium CG10_big_fil_rev_8_21_14_0_10_56_10]|nr:MAG: hypothetical protein COU69_01250 [Candidatus Pacebacteria bacterium CG10_big_fil_rev_8_21_14_0_10_56_10]